MSASPPLSILLAEDHPVNQKIASLMLEKLGYRTEIAVNGLEALQALEHRLFDQVLMDVMMPVMDGIEATWIIRARFIAKPVSMEELRAAIERNVCNRSAVAVPMK